MGKQNVYDHSVHVPLIVAGPGIPTGQRRDQVCYLYDIVPTLLARAGLTGPAEMEFKDLNPVIADAKAEHREHLYFAFMDWQRAVQRGQFKLIEYCAQGERHTQLFDLKADPHELRNLAGQADQTVRLASLRQLLRSEAKRLNDGDTGSPFTTAQGKAFWSAYESTGER